METILSIIAALAVLRLTYRFFFADLDGLVESIKYWLTPDIIALFRGEWGREAWAELRMIFWLLLGVLSGYGVYRFLIS